MNRKIQQLISLQNKLSRQIADMSMDTTNETKMPINARAQERSQRLTLLYLSQALCKMCPRKTNNFWTMSSFHK